MLQYDRMAIRVVGTVGIILLTMVSVWGATPYTPVYPDPVLEDWRWTRFPELLGGTISVGSEVGKGSTFTVCVPLAYKAEG